MMLTTIPSVQDSSTIPKWHFYSRKIICYRKVKTSATTRFFKKQVYSSTICLSVAMEAMLKKYKQKFKQAREQMDSWDQLQAQLLSQFSNASSIIERLQIIRDIKNYGSLRCVDCLNEAVLQKQMESLEMILLALDKTTEEFRIIVMWLDKMVKDGRQLVRGGSHQPSVKQLQLRVGVNPSLTDCLDGLVLLHEMHHDEYLLKKRIVEALPKVVTATRTGDLRAPGDLSALQQLLVDQPNIPKEDVEFIYDIIFAQEIC